MKGDKKLLVIAVLLLLISVSFTTYAIYRETATGNGTIRTANWVVNLDKGVTASTPIATANITFTGQDLNCGSESARHGKNNTIAPGDACTVNFTVDALGSEVDVVVDATVNTTNLPANITVTPSYGGSDNKIPYSTTAMNKTITLSVNWAGALGDTAAKDTADLGLKNTNITIPVTITARQDIS